MIKFASWLNPGDCIDYGTVVSAHRSLDNKFIELVLSGGTEMKLKRYELVRTRRGIQGRNQGQGF